MRVMAGLPKYVTIIRTMFLKKYIFAGFFCLAALCPVVASSAPLAPQESFVRIFDNGDGHRALEVAVADYSWKDGKSISLVSAIHVADKEYYSELNNLLSKYDAVLYELVGPKGAKPIPGMKRGGFLNRLQEGFAELLGVALQLDEVDYSPKNFVHADVSFEELIAEAQRRGDTLFSIIVNVISDMFSMQEKMQNLPFQPKTTAELIALMFDPIMLRNFVAQSLAYVNSDASVTGFATLDPYVIGLRNAKVIEVLREEEVSNKAKTFAVFYGAGHMHDLESRLLNELNAKRTATSWLKAWDLSPKP